MHNCRMIAAAILLMIAAAILLIALASATEHNTAHRARSWKILPTEKDMNISTLHRFQRGLGDLISGEYVSQSASFSSFPVDDALKHMVFSKSIPEEVQGIWWTKDHPTYGAMLASFELGTKTFHGNAGADEPGYVYASMVLPGTHAVPDNKGNKSQLGWLVDHGLAFSLPKWNHASLKVGDSSSFNTYMTGFYGKFPLPAARVEGFTWPQAVKWQLDPKKATDPAHCFCSVIYDGPNKIRRNNFGQFAYNILRVVDGKGQLTPYWEQFKSAMASRGIESFAVVADPSSGVQVELKVDRELGERDGDMIV